MNWTRRSLYLRILVVIIPMMALLLVGTFLGLKSIVTTIGDALSERFASQQVRYDRNRTLQPLLQEMQLARLLATSDAIIDWAERESDAQLTVRGLAELERYRLAFKDGSYFFAIDRSGHYYFNDASNTYAGRQLRYTLSPDHKKDDWYYATIKQNKVCQLNVNLDSELHTTKIWINCLVRRGDRVLGVIGTGLELTNFIRSVLNSKSDGMVNMFVDQDGAIQAYPDIRLIDLHTITNDRDEKKTIYRLLDDESSREHMRNLLATLESGATEVGTTYLDMGGKRVLVGASYLREIGWFDVTVISPELWTLGHSFVPLAALMVVGMLLAIALSVLLIHRIVLSRIQRLDRAVNKIKQGDYSFVLPNDSSDEIGRLTASFNEMAETVRTNQDELRSARDAAESANIAKTNFLGNMSHEMRTPVHQTLAMAKLMRRESLSDKQADKLTKIEAAGARLSTLIERILKLTELESRTLRIEESALSVDQLLDEVLDLARDRAQAKGLALINASESMPAILIGDASGLKTALLCYVQNAIAFTESGSVTIRAKILEQNVDSAHVHFEVRDTGVGVDPAVIPRLFSIFEQADNSGTRKHSGTGVGLALVKKLAGAMGGDASCSSLPGQGSSFWFTARLKKPTVP